MSEHIGTEGGEGAKDDFRLEIMKKNPKPNAVTYRIETINDIFKAVTPDNIEKFLHEFELVLRSGILLKATAETVEKGAGEGIHMPYFDWIDD